MRSFRDIPIKQKLIRVIMLTSGVVVLLTCLVFVGYEAITYKNDLIHAFQTLGEVIAGNSDSSVQFQDEQDARKVLSTMGAEKNVTLAAIYTLTNLFVSYPTNAPVELFPRLPFTDVSPRAAKGSIEFFVPIKSKDEKRLGTVYIKASLTSLHERYRLYASIAVVVMLIVFLIAFILSNSAQRRISDPILELADVARRISKKRDYSVRAVKFGEDELGALTDAFNHMLTQIHERDAALRESEERLRLALAASGTAVWNLDLATGRMSWDEHATHLLGREPEAVPRTFTAFLDLIHSSDREVLAEAARQAKESRKDVDVEFRILCPDDSVRHVVCRGRAIFDDKGKPVRLTGVCLDVSHKKLAEEAIRTLNTELERRVLQRTAELAQTNKELEAFTYSVSHDLRAPLRMIAGFAQILQEETGPRLAPHEQHYLQRIRKGTQNMGQLVDDLLNLAHLGRSEVVRQTTDLNVLLEEALNSLKPEMANRQIEWRTESLPVVECDPGLVQQVFVNLLSNAIKYTRRREKALIEVGWRMQGKEPVIFVRDNGVGFSMKYAGKLFGVFQRLHRQEEFEGTGVGLATVDRIIEKHGGRIWAEAEVDKGATFYFTIGQSKAR